MKCHVPGPNVKILARGIHALARFGDDLFVDSQPEGLFLRTLNSAESAYAVVKYNLRFFSHFNHDYYSTEDDTGLKCKISMRSALNVFKSPAQLDKQVENLEIKLEPEACKLIFTLRCRHGVVKTHYVHILDCKAMQAVFTTDLVPNKIMASQRVLIDALSNFQSSDDQATIQVSPQTFLLRNYVDDNMDSSKLIRTQVNIRPIEFESFFIKADTQISFSLKEFRALLTFSENLSLPIHVSFETEGKPVVFVIHNSSTFEATFVLATQKPDADTATTTPATSAMSENRKRSIDITPRSSRKKQHVEVSKQLDEDSHLFDFVNIPDENLNVAKSKKFGTVTDYELSDNVHLNNKSSMDIGDDQDILGLGCQNSERILISNGQGTHVKNGIDMGDDVDIPRSPTAFIKVQTLFKRCFDVTLDMRNTQHVILAENSDSE